MAGKYTGRPLTEDETIPPARIQRVSIPSTRGPFYRAMERIQRTMEPGRWIEFATYDRARTAAEIVQAVSEGTREVPDERVSWEMRSAEVLLAEGEHDGAGTITGSRLFVMWQWKPGCEE